MSSDIDKDTSQRVAKALTEDLSSIDVDVANKIQAARYRALENFEDSVNRPHTARFPMVKAGLVPGLIFACASFVVAGIWLVQQPGEPSEGKITAEQTTLYQIGTEEISSAELELVEELEFYEWLDSNGYAG